MLKYGVESHIAWISYLGITSFEMTDTLSDTAQATMCWTIIY